MKGIILAGGSGTRLFPLTKTTSKQLLPVYDKPMIYYPFSTMMLFDIREVLIISTPTDIGNIQKLFGDGAHLGMNIKYAVQPYPKGIAQAFTLDSDFVGNDNVSLILGDNIFYMSGIEQYKKQIDANADSATIFTYRVSNPQRFGVVEFDKDYNVVSIEEKPQKPKSNYVSVGLYFYPPDVVQKAAELKPSARGEYEITDLNNVFLKEKRLHTVSMGRGNAWLDAGTPDSLIESGAFIQTIEKRTGQKIGCIEEIAYNKKFIDDNGLDKIIAGLPAGIEYRKYLESLRQR